MMYQPTHTNAEHCYSVGIDTETGEHLIAVIITWVAWYSIYFRLKPDEVIAFHSDPDSLTPLSYELAADKGFGKHRDRLVYNENPSRR